MLGILRRGQRWLMTIVILLVGGFFVLYLGIGPPQLGGSSGAAVRVGDRTYNLRDVERAKEREVAQIKKTLGDKFDPDAHRAQLDQFAAQSLVQLGLLADAAERLGLRASDEEVRQTVRAMPGAVDESGHFRTAQLRAYAESQFGSEQHFVDRLRDEILAQKLLRVIDSTVTVSDAQVRETARENEEKLKLAFIALDPSIPPAGLHVTKAQVDAFLKKHADRVKEFYQEHRQRYHTPEEVRARHILFRLDPHAAPKQVAKVRARAEKVLARLRAGANFAKVAKEVSQDPGSKARGGDLGFFSRGQMAKAFEKAAFSLKPGQLSGLVRTPFGFHILKVEAHRAAQDRTLDDVKRDIARELIGRDAARTQAQATAERLAQAVRSGKSLTDAALNEGVDIQRTDWLKRNPAGYVPQLGRAPQVLDAAFGLPAAPEEASSDRVFHVGNKLVLFERTAFSLPDAKAVDAQLDPTRKRLIGERRAEAESLWLRAARERLLAAGRLAIHLKPAAGS